MKQMDARGMRKGEAGEDEEGGRRRPDLNLSRGQDCYGSTCLMLVSLVCSVSGCSPGASEASGGLETCWKRLNPE